MTRTATLSHITDVDIIKNLYIPSDVQLLVNDKIGHECVGVIIDIIKESFIYVKRCVNCKSILYKQDRCQTRLCKTNNISKVS